jgi:hypothetical protein
LTSEQIREIVTNKLSGFGWHDLKDADVNVIADKLGGKNRYNQVLGYLKSGHGEETISMFYEEDNKNYFDKVSKEIRGAKNLNELKEIVINRDYAVDTVSALESLREKKGDSFVSIGESYASSKIKEIQGTGSLKQLNRVSIDYSQPESVISRIEKAKEDKIELLAELAEKEKLALKRERNFVDVLNDINKLGKYSAEELEARPILQGRFDDQVSAVRSEIEDFDMSAEQKRELRSMLSKKVEG